MEKESFDLLIKFIESKFDDADKSRKELSQEVRLLTKNFYDHCIEAKKESVETAKLKYGFWLKITAVVVTLGVGSAGGTSVLLKSLLGGG